MEHMAREIKMDPLEFRKLNMIPDGGMRLVSTSPKRVGDILLRYNGISDFDGFFSSFYKILVHLKLQICFVRY